MQCRVLGFIRSSNLFIFMVVRRNFDSIAYFTDIYVIVIFESFESANRRRSSGSTVLDQIQN